MPKNVAHKITSPKNRASIFPVPRVISVSSKLSTGAVATGVIQASLVQTLLHSLSFFSNQLLESGEEIDRYRENHRRILLDPDFGQSLQVSQLNTDRSSCEQ